MISVGFAGNMKGSFGLVSSFSWYRNSLRAGLNESKNHSGRGVAVIFFISTVDFQSLFNCKVKRCPRCDIRPSHNLRCNLYHGINSF